MRKTCFLPWLSILAITTQVSLADDLIVTGPGATTVSGTINGNVIVKDGGFAQLQDAHIKGNLIIKPGGALDSIEGNTSTIEGNVKARGAMFFVLNGDNVCGNVTAKNSGDGDNIVVVLDTFVFGNVRFANNDAALIGVGFPTSDGSFGNMIFGNVELFGNYASGQIFVVDNTINGNLICNENEPDATLSGNSVNGNVECDD